MDEKSKNAVKPKKSNIMIFNFTRNNQFSTRLKMNGEVLPIIKETKLLGTVITDDLKWERNTCEIIKKANRRLLLLRRCENIHHHIVI